MEQVYYENIICGKSTNIDLTSYFLFFLSVTLAKLRERWSLTKQINVYALLFV
jgi:hypothetical protein